MEGVFSRFYRNVRPVPDDGCMTSEWHPIFLTTEISPGVWEMQHATSPDPFGRIEIRRVGDAVRYKVTLRGAVIGWSTTLQVACEQLYTAWIESNERMRNGPPNGAR